MDTLRVRLLGPMELDGVDVSTLRSRKARSLLRLLALGRGRPVAVDRLVDCLWADELPQQPQRDLSAHVSRIRSLVGAERVLRSDAGYALVHDWLDLAELDELAAAARAAFATGNHLVARNAAAAALALVRGPVLSDEADAWWLDEERAAVGRTIRELHRVAAEAALAAGNLGEATAKAEAALDADPYDEAALRVLMSAHARSGRPGSASAAYDKHRAQLGEDLGLSPAPETTAVHAAIVTGELGPVTEVADTLTHAPLPGRDAELARLDEALAMPAATVRVVQVEGDAGIGKTALLDAFARQARSRDALVLRGRCDETGHSLPLQPVADAIAEHLASLGRAAGRDLLGEDGQLLDPLLGLTDTPSATSLISDLDAIRQVAFTALLRLLERAGTGRPVVMMIDDAHHADPSTVAWLRFAGRRPVAHPVLVVTARRPGEGDELEDAVAVSLGPVDLAAARQIVGGDRADALFDRSGGNPLFLVELTAPESLDGLPASIRDVVAKRCDQTGAAAATLRAAAVLGPEADLDLLASALRTPPLTILDHLEEGMRRQLLTEQAGRFMFRHDLVREALVEGTTAARRSLLHREAAHHLVGRARRDPAAVVHHARLAGDHVLAAAALVDAGTLAMGRYAYAEAAEAFDESITLNDSPTARIARARLRLARGDLSGADHDAVIALGLGAGAEALEVRAWAARYSRDIAAAIAFSTEGARTANDPATRARCLLVAGMVNRGIGELAQAEQLLTDAADLEPVAGLGPISAYLAPLRLHQGRARHALATAEPALAGELGLSHTMPVERTLQVAIHANGMLGRPAAALAAVARLRRALVARGTAWRYHGYDENYRSWILRNLADPHAEEISDAVAEKEPLREIHVQAELDRADSRLWRADLDGAARILDDAEALADSDGFLQRYRCEQRAAQLRARLALAAGEPGTAVDRARASATHAARYGDARYETLAAILLARAHHRLGHPVDREEVAAHLRALPDVAGLEAWWMTAEAAADLDVDQWWALAERRVAELVAAAGEDGPAFAARARRRLDELRTHFP